MNFKSPLLWVLIFSIVAAILRFWNLGFQMMNNDEIWTINFVPVSMTVWQCLIHSLSTDYNPPLYYLLAHFSMVVFGETATAIRIPSAIAGVLLVPVMYYLGREYRDELFGLLLSGLTTFFYILVFYSRYGRAYSVAILFFTIAFIYFLRLVKGDARASVPFGIFALLCLWTHLFTVIPLGVMVLYLLWSRKAYTGIAMMVIGALPLLNYIPLVLATRSIEAAYIEQNFGFSWWQLILLVPTDLFGYSVIFLFPILLWALWKYRSDLVIRLITAIFAATWLSMIVLSFETPIIMHYSLWCLPILLIPLLLPVHNAFLSRKVPFTYFCIGMVVVLLESLQIVWLLNQQRISMAI